MNIAGKSLNGTASVILDLLDGGFSNNIFSAFDETNEYFILTKGRLYNSMIKAKKFNLNKLVGVKFCLGCGEYKRTNLFSKNLSGESGYERWCKICSIKTK